MATAATHKRYESVWRALDKAGIEWEHGHHGYDSLYLRVFDPEDDYNEITVRVSDHAPPKGRGGFKADPITGGGAMPEAEVSFHPGGLRTTGAVKAIKTALRKARTNNPMVSRRKAKLGRRKNGLLDFLSAESLRPTSRLLVPTSSQVKETAKEAGRRYAIIALREGKRITAKGAREAATAWVERYYPEPPRGISKRELSSAFQARYLLTTERHIREGNPIDWAETLAIGAGTAAGSLIGETLAGPLIERGKKFLGIGTEEGEDERDREMNPALSNFGPKPLRLPRGNYLPNSAANTAIAEEAIRLAESFHGRKLRDVYEYDEPESYDEDLAQLGELRELELSCNRGKAVCGIQFSPGKDAPMLASSPDGKQLYFIGGDQDLGGNLAELRRQKVDELSAHTSERTVAGKRMIPIAQVHTIAYFADKHHLTGPKQQKAGMEYEHEFGEKSGVKPMLMYDQLNKRMHLVGGDYFVTERGIEN